MKRLGFYHLLRVNHAVFKKIVFDSRLISLDPDNISFKHHEARYLKFTVMFLTYFKERYWFLIV